MYRNLFWHSIEEIKIKKSNAMSKIIEIEDNSINELPEAKKVEASEYIYEK